MSCVANDVKEMEALGPDWQDFKPGKPEMTRAVASPQEAIPNFQEFPKWKHSNKGASCVVGSQAEEDALPGFWFDTKKEAVAFGQPTEQYAQQDEQDPVSEAAEIAAKQKADADEMNDLADQAVAVGLKVNKTWGLSRLRKEVQAAKEAANG